MLHRVFDFDGFPLDLLHMLWLSAMELRVRFLERTRDRDFAVSQIWFIGFTAVLFPYSMIPHAIDKQIRFLSPQIHNGINEQ